LITSIAFTSPFSLLLFLSIQTQMAMNCFLLQVQFTLEGTSCHLQIQ